METKGQELNRIEVMKALVREQFNKQVEKYDRAIQELKDQQSRDMEEVRSLLIKLQPAITPQLPVSSTPNARSMEDKVG